MNTQSPAAFIIFGIEFYSSSAVIKGCYLPTNGPNGSGINPRRKIFWGLKGLRKPLVLGLKE